MKNCYDSELYFCLSSDRYRGPNDPCAFIQRFLYSEPNPIDIRD